MMMSPFLEAAVSRLYLKLPQGSLSSGVGLQADKDTADPSKAAPRRNPARSYAAVAVSGSEHTASLSKEFADRGITLDAASSVTWLKVFIVEEDSDGFSAVAERRQPLVPLRSSSSSCSSSSSSIRSSGLLRFHSIFLLSS
jgi:hypothetical protein